MRICKVILKKTHKVMMTGVFRSYKKYVHVKQSSIDITNESPFYAVHQIYLSFISDHLYE